MVAVKRMEIVADATQLEPLVEILRSCGAPGWTILKNVAGFGGRGVRDADQPTDVLGNVMILVACDETLATTIVDRVRPILTRFGGICLVSDAQSAKH
jgi:nitrogen regulatory protein PII